MEINKILNYSSIREAWNAPIPVPSEIFETFEYRVATLLGAIGFGLGMTYEVQEKIKCQTLDAFLECYVPYRRIAPFASIGLVGGLMSGYALTGGSRSLAYKLVRVVKTGIISK